MAYEPKVYKTDGGDKLVVASSGEIEFQSGSTLDVQSGATLDFDGNLNMGDDDQIQFGTGSDVTIDWDTTSTDVLKVLAAANNTEIEVGTAAKSLDLVVSGSAGTITFDASADTLDFNAVDVNLQDDDMLAFGDANDVTVDWDTTSTDVLKVLAAANNTEIEIGTAAKSLDLVISGSAGTITFDASADTLDFNAVDLNLQDDDLLAFGDANDVTVDWDTTSTDVLKVLPAANNTEIEVGAAATSFDLVLAGSASNSNVTWDASANQLQVNQSELYMADSTATFQLYLGAAANTANIGPGGMRLHTNSTGVLLSVNTTGTTWKTAQLS